MAHINRGYYLITENLEIWFLRIHSFYTFDTNIKRSSVIFIGHLRSQSSCIWTATIIRTTDFEIRIFTFICCFSLLIWKFTNLNEKSNLSLFVITSFTGFNLFERQKIVSESKMAKLPFHPGKWYSKHLFSCLLFHHWHLESCWYCIPTTNHHWIVKLKIFYVLSVERVRSRWIEHTWFLYWQYLLEAYQQNIVTSIDLLMLVQQLLPQQTISFSLGASRMRRTFD